MDNLALKLIDNMEEENQTFIIDDDSKAEWALVKISEETAETQRMINVCETMILRYQEEILKYKTQLESKTGYLKEQLKQYFTTVPHKETKTQETYKLPSGTLKLKKPSQEFIRDEETLLKWAKSNATDYVKTKESVNWAELKKVTQISGEHVCIDGEIVEGITVQEKPASFEIEF